MINKLKEFVILHGKLFYIKKVDSFFVQKNIFSEVNLDSLETADMQPAYIAFVPEENLCYEEFLGCIEKEVETIGIYICTSGIILKYVTVSVEINEDNSEPERIILKCLYSDILFEENRKIPSDKRMKPFISLICDYEDRRV